MGKKKEPVTPGSDGVHAHGFTWGNIDVRRSAIVTNGAQERHRVLSITTPRRMVHVAVTPTGLVRIEEKANKTGWMPTPRKDPRQLSFPWDEVPSGADDPMTPTPET